MGEAQHEGLLEKRGMLNRWASVYVMLRNGNVLSWYDAKNRSDEKGRMTIEHCEPLSGSKGNELAFSIHFKDDKSTQQKWVLRTKTQEEFDKLTGLIKKNLEDTGVDEYNYGLPANDPRTNLPLISVPREYKTNFGYLNMAVMHWFGPVKKLGAGFSVEERVCVLGDRCLYLCKKNADITRCVMITDIEKLLLAQDDSKDLYISIIMPREIANKIDPGKPARPEYDLMFHAKDIQTFVRYLRTVYVYQTQGKMLPLEQVKDKSQLATDVMLTRPKGWELMYWQPMFKEQLAQMLQQWQEQTGGGGAAPTAADQPAPALAPTAAAAPAAGGASLGGGASPARGGYSGQPSSSSPADALKALETSDPLGKLLVVLGLAKYYPALQQKKMTLDLMTCGLIDDSDLYHFGIENDADRATLIAALADEALVDKLQAGTSVDDYKPAAPPAAAKGGMAANLASDYAGAKPNIALDDDLDLDLDGGGPAVAGLGGGGGGGGDLDLDLDDFGALDVAPGGPAVGDLDLDDLDVGGPAKAGGGVSLDDDLDLDVGGGPAKPAGGGINLDDDL